jgi:hypothetical protein
MIIDEKALRSLLREVAVTGTPSSSAGRSGRDDKAVMTTIPTPLPVSPSMHSATQLSVERPPVEDPEYVPANKVELGRALQAVGETVPDKFIKEFYLMVLKLYGRIPKENVVGEGKRS